MGGDRLDGLRVVDPGGGRGERALVGIGGEDAHRQLDALVVQLLQHQHRVGVGLVTHGAGRDPDADLTVLGPGLGDDRRDDRGGEVLPDLGIAEEGGDPDQQVVVEGAELDLVGLHEPRVDRDVGGPGQLHPPLDAPPDGADLVGVEVEPVRVAQRGDDPAELAVAVGRHRDPGAVGVLGELLDGLGHVGRREDLVDRAGAVGAARHRGEASAAVLHDREPARGADGLDAGRPVVAGAGQHDGDGVRAPRLGQ